MNNLHDKFVKKVSKSSIPKFLKLYNESMSLQMYIVKVWKSVLKKSIKEVMN